MECYIFGNLGAGFTQYMNDHTQGILKNSTKYIKDKCQLIIHRDDNIMYYIYIRRLSTNNVLFKRDSQYIGIALKFYNENISEFRDFMRSCDTLIGEIADKGLFCKYAENNIDIVGTKIRFEDKLGEADKVHIRCTQSLKSFSNKATVLSKEEHNFPADTNVIFSYHDNSNEIYKASTRYPYTIIYVNHKLIDGYDNSMQKKLDELRKENEQLKSLLRLHKLL